ncbi:MAG: 3-dehydroquinate synthase [Desulfotomaculaceae bacterium]|nr:3-dehydroquinate synthase [Desulfotomaculaceae bacterium]
MITVGVDLGARSYNIYIGSGILGRLGSWVRESSAGDKALLVSNRKVFALYGETVSNSLAEHGYQAIPAEMGDGEEYKNLATLEKLFDLAFTRGLDRRCPVIALGGGVVGDAAGLAAATYLRGVPFVQVPTTLLAQVDSSVGGKVAVNRPGGKNIVGAFYQPELVAADMLTLQTLPRREIKCGLAELIKYGVICDAGFFSWLEENIDKVLSLDEGALAYAVAVACRSKARVVEADETEQGQRAILNFGHTAGHAVEVLSGYGVFCHGEAVAAGMASAARLAAAMGLLPAAQVRRIVSLLSRAGLPVSLPPSLDSGDMIAAMRQDKKARAGRLTFVLPLAIGSVKLFDDLPEELVREALFQENS